MAKIQSRSYEVSPGVISACLGVSIAWGTALIKKHDLPHRTIQEAVSAYVVTVKSPQTAARRSILAKEMARRNNVFKKLDAEIRKGEKITPKIAKERVDKALEKYFEKVDLQAKSKEAQEKNLAALAEFGETIVDGALSANQPEVEVEDFEPMDLPRQLEEAKKEAAYCHKQMTRNRKNPPMYDYWKKQFDKSFKQTFEVERDIMKIQLEAGKVAPVEIIEKQMLELAKRLVQHIDRVPQRISRSFAGKQKIAVMEAGKKESAALKDILYEFAIVPGG